MQWLQLALEEFVHDHRGGVRVLLAPGEGDVRLVVSNEADDLAAADASRLFDRFYRTDAARSGTHAGLGLSIVQALVQKMGGSVTADLLNGNLVVTVRLCPADAPQLP